MTARREGRSPAEEHVRYNWITPKTFGERIGGEQPKSPSHVRRLIRDRAIRPEMVHVTNPGAKRKDYRINPRAVQFFISDHSLAGDDDAGGAVAQ